MDTGTGRIESLLNHGLLGQLVRFGIVGVLSTAVYAAVYLPLVYRVLPTGYAFVAVLPAFVVAAAFGFVAHGRWSFRDHGERRGGAEQPLKFLVVQGFGMALNAGFTFVIADMAGGPEWLPLVPAMLVTPIATFALNRKWVFG
ncbi:GtrA family protein [Sphingomonas sp. CFBP 13720]|uniref:GtrA family protein n=1 Tax=Sphingomonas sp. CFBP 13720 TaxID=2775302 RepID=UPI003138AC21